MHLSIAWSDTAAITPTVLCFWPTMFSQPCPTAALIFNTPPYISRLTGKFVAPTSAPALEKYLRYYT